MKRELNPFVIVVVVVVYVLYSFSLWCHCQAMFDDEVTSLFNFFRISIAWNVPPEIK